MESPTPTHNLSALVIPLLKGVIYRENDERQWGQLLQLQARVRDYVSVLQLELVLDEAEGYAFLKSPADTPEDAQGPQSPSLPRLIARRPLSFQVSLLLALLRKKLAETDASGGETRLVLSRDDILELLRVFLPDTSNEVKLIDQLETTLNKVVELGFLHKLKTSNTPNGPAHYEIKRLLKAFIDAQWLAEFNDKLEVYRQQLAQPQSTEAP